MRTFDLHDRRGAWAVGRRALEAVGLALVFALVPERVAWPLAAVGAPHPGWCAVLVLAARYGVGGLLSGLIASAWAIALGAMLAGTPLLEAWNRLHGTGDLLAFGACIGVAWVGAWHLRRRQELREALAEITGRLRQADETVNAQREVVTMLRARVDRSSSSLSFLRDVAERLEGADPIAAAEGAADLALARTGASAVAIHAGHDGLRRPLAVRDARGPRMIAPLHVRDASLVVPIHRGREHIGSLVLWEIPPPGPDLATMRDLEIVASWCAEAIGGVSLRLERVPESGPVRP